MSLSKYIAKTFGSYAIEVCSKTNYINALHMLNVYNDKYDVQKSKKRMIFHMKGNKFTKQIIADFEHIVDNNKVEYEYLDNLINERVDDKLQSASKLSKTDLKTLSKNIKYKYMIREIATFNGNAKTISNLDIHPISAVGLAMWLSPSFGSEVKSFIIKYINGEMMNVINTIYIREPNNRITYFDNMTESYIDIDIPEQNNKNDVIDGSGYLYFIKEIMPYKDDLYLYKVGFSNNPDSRFKTHQCSNSRKLIMYRNICCKDYKNAERYMHNYFTNRRAQLGGGTEWFLLRDNEVDKICDLA